MSEVSGSDLLEELRLLASPSTSGFSVRAVPGAEGYKIGRGIDGVIGLFTPPDPQPDPPTRLRTLQLAPTVRVRLERDDATVMEADHGLVQLLVEDGELFEPFLAVAATLIRLLGPEPAPGEVSAGMRRLVKIFDPTQPPRGSALGLWAELLLIATSIDSAKLVDAWHAHTDARFDFSAEGSRLEVKATTKSERHHIFNLRQLQPIPGSGVVVASLMTTETEAGTSIGDLVARLEQLLSGDGDRQMKVHAQVAETLASDWARYLGRRFDERQAEESLAFLAPDDIPQVERPPAEVLDVRLTVDCTDVPQQTSPTGIAALLRSQIPGT